VVFRLGGGEVKKWPFVPDWLAEALRRYEVMVHWVRQSRVLYGIEQRVHRRGLVGQVECEFLVKRVRRVLDGCGVWSDWHPIYLSYAFRLDKAQRELEFMVDLRREHKILRGRFEGRGLDPKVLDKIDEVIIRRRSGRVR